MDTTAGQGDMGDTSDPWSAFSARPSAWRTTYQPLLVPGAGRELVYSVQVSGTTGWKVGLYKWTHRCRGHAHSQACR